MRFSTSASPTLTPLGLRLMSLSRTKLDLLDSYPGRRDSASALRMGVLVRQAVRTAWASIERGPSELTNWRAPTALGLDTLTEEDEEEDYDQEAAEAAWLDDVLSSFGDEGHEDDHDDESAWTETVTVSQPSDDFDYDDDTMQAFALPESSSMDMDVDEADALVSQHLGSHNADVTVVEVAVVDDWSDCDDDAENTISSWMELDEVSHIEFMEHMSPAREPNTPSATHIIPLLREISDVKQHVYPLYNNYSVFGETEEYGIGDDSSLDCGGCGDCDTCDVTAACPDLLDPGPQCYRRDSECNSGSCDCDDDDEDDGCCPPTPPLMSCENLECVATQGSKGVTLWSGDVDWNLDALTI